MRVLLISLVYEPDRVSTAQITARLAAELHALGHDVTVITSVPHFNLSDGSRARRRRRDQRPWTTSDEGGVRVIRCYIPPKPTEVWRRLSGFAVFHLLVLAAAVWHGRDREQTVIISPPLTLALAGMAVRRLGHGRLVYNAQELWPDVPRDLGVITNPRVLAALGALERWIYRSSDCVVTIGSHLEKAVRERGATNARTIPNFVDTTWIVPTSKANDLARHWGLIQRPVVLYAGNIGLTQDFDALFDVAEARPEVEVVLVGAGAARAIIERRINTTRPPNVRLLPFVAETEVSNLYGLADVVVVPLKPGHDRTTLPSKVFSAMAAARPLVVAAADDTDLAATVRDSRAGLVVCPGNSAAFVQAVERVLDGKLADAWDPEYALRSARRHSATATAAEYDALFQERSRA